MFVLSTLNFEQICLSRVGGIWVTPAFSVCLVEEPVWQLSELIWQNVLSGNQSGLLFQAYVQYIIE